MTLITKPDFTYVWASGGAIVAPNDTKKQQGWVAEAPPFQYDNWLQNRQDQMLAHINQRGIAAWDALTNYEAGGLSYVQGSDGKVYKSVAASGPSSVVSNPTTDVTDTYWTIAFADVGAFLTQATGDTRYTQRSNNLSDLTNVATARTNLALGTAATATLTTSATDPTVGSLTKVGDFGVGGMLDLRGTIFVTGKPQDIYSKGFAKGFADGGPAGLAIPGIVSISYGVLELNGHWSEPSGAGGIIRSFTRGDSGVVYTQTMVTATTWGPWREIALTNSPAFIGTPTAPTAAAGTSTTQVATTAFVTTADNLKANINSPTFTGVPSAPTAATGTNTEQLATTAFAYGLASKAQNGYVKLPNGVIIQWADLPSGTTSIAFPIAFPTLCASVATGQNGAASSSITRVAISAMSTTTLTLQMAIVAGAVPARYIAIGY